jgi:hypothetical protein
MPAFYRRHEAALATQSQVWIESLSLTTERRRQAVERALQLAEHQPRARHTSISARWHTSISASRGGIQISHHACHRPHWAT